MKRAGFVESPITGNRGVLWDCDCEWFRNADGEPTGRAVFTKDPPGVWNGYYPPGRWIVWRAGNPTWIGPVGTKGPIWINGKLYRRV